MRSRPRGLEIAATCKIAELYAFEPPKEWTAGPLIGECCRSFLASFKIWNEATVGGNICMSLPAGPMISLTAALEGVYDALAARGRTASMCAAIDFVTGNHQNVLRPANCCAASTCRATRSRNASRSGADRSRISGVRRCS